MEIKLWSNFNKRRNSTKQPSDASATNKNVILKESASIENPTFILTSITAPEWNYVKAFGHYYFVTDIISLTHSMWEIRCEQDVLATHKSAIGAYNGLVMYSSSNYDLDLYDSRMSFNDEVIVSKSEYDIAFGDGSTHFTAGADGTYILGVINGKNNGSCGTVTYYAMTPVTLTRLSNNILVNPDFFELLSQTFNDPMNSIVSCRYLPISGIPGHSENVYIGADTSGNTNVIGDKIENRKINRTNQVVELQIPFPSIMETANYFRGKEITTATLYLPFVGIVPFDLPIFYNNAGFLLNCTIDIITGDIVYKISKNLGGGQSTVIATHSGNCSTNVPLSSKGYDANGVVGGIVSTIGGVATAVAGAVTGGAGAVIAAGTSAGAAGVIKTASSLEIHTSVKGSESTALGASLGIKPILTLYTQTPADDIESMKTEKGLPLFKTVQISTLSGYVQCSGASVSLGSLSGDRDVVNSFLNNGFYYE